MRVVVTRPRLQAQAWVHKLVQLGIDAVALPLIDIQAPPDPQAVVEAWAGLTAYSLVAFVSPNAVISFWQQCPAGLHWPAHVLIGSMGPGTTQALRDHGVSPHQILEPDPNADQFDAESLWLQLVQHDWRGQSVLLVRGEGGREWLAQTLLAHGAVVETVCTYQRGVPCLTPAEQAVLNHALKNPLQHAWFFSSSQSIQHLRQLVPQADWHHSQALVTHPAIAQQARASGWQYVHLSRPLLADVAACIQSIAL
jgi:uroporphyrinogen-III synthase